MGLRRTGTDTVGARQIELAGPPARAAPRRGMRRWLLVLLYLITVIVPLYGQLVGLIAGIVLLIRPYRRRHGAALVVLSLFMCLAWLVLVAASSGPGVPAMCC